MHPLCPQCGGHGMSLGTLGSLWHLRCRYCGWDWSINVAADEVSEVSEASCCRCGIGLGHGEGLDSETCSDCDSTDEDSDDDA